LTFAASRAAGLQGLSHLSGRVITQCHHPGPLMDFRSAPRSTLHELPLAEPPLMGFDAPSAYEAQGSDRHRACLTRLRCASRLSQPPDAFLPPSALAAFFHAADAHGVLPFRGFPS
jgi:hypothetical protein